MFGRRSRMMTGATTLWVRRGETARMIAEDDIRPAAKAEERSSLASFCSYGHIRRFEPIVLTAATGCGCRVKAATGGWCLPEALPRKRRHCHLLGLSSGGRPFVAMELGEVVGGGCSRH